MRCAFCCCCHHYVTEVFRVCVCACACCRVQVMSEFVKLEAIKRDNAVAKNDLESYIIKTRDLLDSDEELKKVRAAGSGSVCVGHDAAQCDST